jgi:hypothetical protein
MLLVYARGKDSAAKAAAVHRFGVLQRVAEVCLSRVPVQNARDLLLDCRRRWEAAGRARRGPGCVIHCSCHRGLHVFRGYKWFDKLGASWEG